MQSTINRSITLFSLIWFSTRFKPPISSIRSIRRSSIVITDLLVWLFKNFFRIHHNFLLRKLQQIAVQRFFNSWITDSFSQILQRRRICQGGLATVCSEIYSSWFFTGEQNCLLLFLIMVNDLAHQNTPAMFQLTTVSNSLMIPHIRMNPHRSS